VTSLPDYRTKTQIIVDAVRGRIMSGESVPGERLIIRAIADQFACSDIPVREALRTLESEGLVTIVPHGGARVSELNGEELLELTEARSLLEPEATVQAAARMGPAEVALLREIAARMRSADAAAAADYGRLNREFHRAILVHCPNRMLHVLIEDLWDRAERGRAVHRLFEGHRGTSLEHHDEIVRCIAARDLGRLRAASLAHSAHGLAAIRRLIEDDRLAERRQAPDGG
jgi:DNA-binding GntR family transcriptional regulator